MWRAVPPSGRGTSIRRRYSWYNGSFMASATNTTGTDSIVVRGVRVHNLKNINFDIPHNALTIVTGVSGSGKSSLAFDTIYAEGQRRYIESLSAYARQFLERIEKPDIDEVHGIAPAIAIRQRNTARTPRSTVGTSTELYDYLRLLFARVGVTVCRKCGSIVQKDTVDQIADVVMQWPLETRFYVLYPLPKNQSQEQLAALLSDLKRRGFSRLYQDGRTFDYSQPESLLDVDFSKTAYVLVDRLKIAPDIRQRLIDSIEICFRENNGEVILQVLDWPPSPYGNGSTPREKQFRFSESFECKKCGIRYEDPETKIYKLHVRVFLSRYRGYTVCPECDGSRLRKEARDIFINDKNIAHVCRMTIQEGHEFFSHLSLSPAQAEIAERILLEIQSRLKFLNDVGLQYLTLERLSSTLSGGEAQRIQLATSLGSSLVGALYVLDEPSIGLHPRDGHRLIQILKRLRDIGNTVLIVDQAAEMMKAADHILDLGPGAGENGGHLVYGGTLEGMKNCTASLTGKYLIGELKVPIPKKRRTPGPKMLKLKNAAKHNLKDIDIEIPIGLTTCITGVSGSGKSTLVHECLFEAINAVLHGGDSPVGTGVIESRLKWISQVVLVDQSPIGRTPRSNPVTYIKAFDHIRDVFASTREAQARGYNSGSFSFNIPGGRCEVCQGDGTVTVEMQFLADVELVCEECKGTRYKSGVLEVLYKGKNVYQVLQMTVREALLFFASVPKITKKLKVLEEVGLGYLRLGQSATTLSGGEAQRIKLASFLARETSEKTLFIFDEPTTGLHFDDINKLLVAFKRLIEAGGSVLIIEHNLDVIKSADWLIDLGPEGGDAGGFVVATGSPEQVMENEASITGQFLKNVLSA